MDEATRQLLAELAPDENLGQCISRHAKDTITLGVPLLDLAPTFNKTDVIEVCGQTGTGKSELLYSVCALDSSSTPSS